MQIIEGTRAWRDSWLNLLNAQLGAATEYEGLYDPIVGATDGHGRETAPTPDLQLRRTLRLKEVYNDLRAEMVEDISMIDSRLIKPASDARDCINPVRKTIKKREYKRLDYEKCQDKVNKLTRKLNKTPKEDSSLAKAEQEMLVLAEVCRPAFVLESLGLAVTMLAVAAFAMFFSSDVVDNIGRSSK
jgi:amphiphysin